MSIGIANENFQWAFSDELMTFSSLQLCETKKTKLIFSRPKKPESISKPDK